MFEFTVMHRLFPVGFYVRVASGGRGIWIGGSFHACADCTQLTLRLLIVDIVFAIAKKSDEDQQYLDALYNEKRSKS